MGTAMTLQDWGAIGEIIGAIGVIASLIYLASQIRTSNKHAASASLHGMTTRAEQRMLSIVTTPDLASLYNRWLAGEPLQEDEDLKMSAWFMTWMTDLEECYRQTQLGLLPASALETRLTNVLGMLTSVHARAHWERFRPMMDPDFVGWFALKLDQSP